MEAWIDLLKRIAEGRDTIHNQGGCGSLLVRVEFVGGEIKLSEVGVQCRPRKAEGERLEESE